MVFMAIDAMRLAMNGQIDRVVLVSGDSDLAPLLEDLRNMGVDTELVYSPDTPVHRDLLNAADERTEIDQAFVDEIVQDENQANVDLGRSWQNKKSIQTLRSILETYAEHQSEYEEEEEGDQEEAA